ncbi:MAG: ACP phosphodiesterase [Bacteroidales bacterium]|nr:ACP phosphodiesterase [Bacteroidales bacterium]
MNFLAHIFLSGDNEAVKFGNFTGDWVKGKSYNNFPREIQKGILLHRKIDSYTDSHNTVKKSILKIRPAYGKYSGVVTDILYDHFLAQNWQIYSESSLKDYVGLTEKLTGALDFKFLV